MLNPPALCLVRVPEKEYRLEPNAYKLPLAGSDIPVHAWVCWNEQAQSVFPLSDDQIVVGGVHGLTFHAAQRGEPVLIKCLVEVAVLNRYVVCIWTIQED